ncbi:type II toxin-antitoxin system VapC family toxin [Candidatus Roizmanbacteria bacterium]|nr:type II toxin-antitoxin system VapC family toxin [Candidatus Roizmanbacteria bacterium]
MDGNKKIVVGDADSLIALVNEDDANHELSVEISRVLLIQKIPIIYPTTAILEASAKLQRGLSDYEKADSILRSFNEDKFIAHEVDSNLIKEAYQYFSSTTSKKNTIFDSIVAVVGKKYKADFIFSFDGWYPKLGFKPAKELLG